LEAVSSGRFGLLVSWTLKGLRDAGFEGPFPIAELRASKCSAVPIVRGVYLVLADRAAKPRFLQIGTGGHFKQRDPNVSLTKLEANWIPRAPVLYIGQAGGRESGGTLRKRLWTYLRFGAREPVGHRGGRYIWQIDGAESLRICWKTTPDDDPREVEKSLVVAFRDRYGRLPFANLQI
jgi:hypothetical protein